MRFARLYKNRSTPRNWVTNRSKHPLASLVAVLCLLAGTLTRAQPYTASEQTLIAESARRLVKDKYLANLEILTHYEANQPVEALHSHIRGLVRDAFRGPDVQVYNEFRPAGSAYTTVEEYVKDCRIFAGGKPVVTELNFDDAHYVLQQTADGRPYINLYIHKQLRGTDKKGKPFQFRQLTEFRVTFVFDPQLTLFHNFRIAGIDKVDKWPSMAFTITAADVAQAQQEEKDLPVVLTELAGQIKNNLPPGTQALMLEMFTYNRCGVNNALSDRIFATLGNSLRKQASVNVFSPAQNPAHTLLVRGYYRPDLNHLQLVAELYDPRTGQLLKTLTNTDLPLTWLSQQQLKLKPDNYDQVVAIRDSLRHTPSTAPTTALDVTIRTSKGRASVEYWEGSKLVVEAKANRPCHLRLVYLLADGEKTLLERDFEIKPGEENRYIRIAPNASFVCSAPFGTEYLMAYATEDAFCPLPTTPNPTLYIRNDDGYTVFVGSLTNMINAVTCTKNRRQVVQDRIQITTRSLN